MLRSGAKKICHAPGAPHACLVWQGVSRLDNLDRSGVQPGIDVTVLRDGQTAMEPGTQDVVQGGDHGHGGFSTADDPDAVKDSQVVVTPANGQQVATAPNVPPDCRTGFDGSQRCLLDRQDRASLLRALN
jgi:hypothetical protein